MNEQEREELRAFARSASLKADFQYLASHRYNPLVVDGTVDMDRVVEFLTAYNEFINHTPRTFTPIADANMKL